jgi:hypothetical protein
VAVLRVVICVMARGATVLCGCIEGGNSCMCDGRGRHGAAAQMLNFPSEGLLLSGAAGAGMYPQVPCRVHWEGQLLREELCSGLHRLWHELQQGWMWDKSHH